MNGYEVSGFLCDSSDILCVSVIQMLWTVQGPKWFDLSKMFKFKFNLAGLVLNWTGSTNPQIPQLNSWGPIAQHKSCACCWMHMPRKDALPEPLQAGAVRMTH